MHHEAKSHAYAFGTLIHGRDVVEGEMVEWNARWHRRRRSHHPTGPWAVSWWLSFSFTIGSVLFVVGGIATIIGAAQTAVWLNVIGATVFSVGAVLALIEAIDAAKRLGLPGVSGLWATAGGRAAIIQIISAAGFFQIAMVAGLATNLGWAATDVWVWTPSTIGSIGFVVSSFISVQEARPAADIGATSALCNLTGSMCFLLGSLAGYLAQGPVDVPGNDFANPVFLAGSALFFAGSIFGLAELRQPLGQHQTSKPLSPPGTMGRTPYTRA